MIAWKVISVPRSSGLAAPERLRIIQYLAEGPRNVTEIAEVLSAPLGNISHHLAVLRIAGLIQSCKQGRFIVYCLTPGLLEKNEQEEHLNLGCCRLEMPPKAMANRN